MSDERTNLLGMTKEELSAFSQRIGEASYRGSQLYRWLYARGATSFATMTDLGKEFRKRLEDAARIGGVTLQARRGVQSGTEPKSFSSPLKTGCRSKAC
jgi:23S rRNA (adenine2503-C2)-methyltransferase